MVEPLKLSIVTPSFNSIHTIRETMESVAHQDYPHVEHIVVDGGSTDGTVEIIKSYPRVRWISEKDEGHYHAMNKGISMATGEVVGILNADDCYCEGTLTKVAKAFQAHPEWAALFGDYIFIDGEGKELYRREEAGWDPQILRFGFNYVNHQTLFVRKSTYDQLGLLRHKDFKNCCDHEFLMRMASAKSQVGHIREYFILYRLHEFGQSADRRITRNMIKEGARIQKEYGYPGGLAGKLLYSYARMKRQVQKLLYLRKLDVPGLWTRRKHMREQTQFSSNTRFDDL